MSESNQAAPGQIFISYRQEETSFPASWLYEQLVERLGRDRVFKDVDSIELGDNFVEAIINAVGSCGVLLALIGNRWLTVTDAEGKRRIDQPDDFVRLEIETALARNVQVIPILVDGARIPPAGDLPASIAELAYRQGLELRANQFNYDLGRLLRVLDNPTPPTGPELSPTPAEHDIELFRRFQDEVNPDGAPIEYLRQATLLGTPQPELEIELDGRDADQIMGMLDLASPPFINEEVEESRSRFIASVKQFAEEWLRKYPRRSFDESWPGVCVRIDAGSDWFELCRNIVQTHSAMFATALRNNLTLGRPLEPPPERGD